MIWVPRTKVQQIQALASPIREGQGKADKKDNLGKGIWGKSI